MYVLSGPVSGSGYAWYEVVPLTSPSLPSGWVASGDGAAERWIAPSTFECPRKPSDFRSLSALPRAVGLLCFPRMPIGVDVSLVSCNCDADGPSYTPSWFFLGSGSPILMVEPKMTRVPKSWFILNLDPAAEGAEDPLPLGTGEVVHMIGIFDHPASAGCTRTEMDGEPVPSTSCRLVFAVTNVLR